jgi:hypothetical protein
VRIVKQILERAGQKAGSVIRTSVGKANTMFNALSERGKRTALLIFGAVMGGISIMLIMQALGSQENDRRLSIESIKTPKDIYMKEQTEAISQDELIPVGKLKGEMDGEFEAFYLAVDREGKTYMNPWPGVSREAYQKSNGWREISRQELARYEKQLHFFPARSIGLKP